MSHILFCLKSFKEIGSLVVISCNRKYFITRSYKYRTNCTCASNETTSTKQYRNRSLVIGTHDGRFHCDEVLACWMLKQLPQYKNATIIRTRDMSKLDACDIVVDVGGVYDPEKNRFDHHQRTFTGTMKSLAGLKWVTKLSSCGLIYLHMGRDVISELVQLPKSDSSVEKLYMKMYDKLIEEVDAGDNTINQYNGRARFQVSSNLASRIRLLNPAWNETNPDFQAGFEKAMEICGDEFTNLLRILKNAWLPAHQVVEEAIIERHTVDPSGEIIVFKHAGCPWEEHLFHIEKKHNIFGKIKFILFESVNCDWRVRCVHVRHGSFENRLSLPEEWRGLRGEDLSTVSGIPNCVFVHASGFIGGNNSFSGALEMAKVTLARAK